MEFSSDYLDYFHYPDSLTIWAFCCQYATINCAALLAPTAMNQQKFTLTLENGRAQAKAGAGFYTKVDLGIVKYHFEAAAGKENFQWA